ncbi:MAG: diguanylate cyclase [Thermoleophilia bacterium]|nr:diguanylate cyclase [Thermoleophilia bacterium]
MKTKRVKLQKRSYLFGIAGMAIGLAYASYFLFMADAYAIANIILAPILLGTVALYIGRGEEQARSHTQELEDSRQHFSSLANRAIKKKDWQASIFDPAVPNCWEVMDCAESVCPSYGKKHEKCWLTAGTYCHGKIQGKFATKIGDCSSCEVYQGFVGEDAIMEIGEVFNNLIWVLNENDELLKAANRELTASNQELKILHEQALERSETDSLTGLRNHGHFHFQLAKEIERSKRYERPLSLLMLDLDNFKQVNDIYGHPKGDAVLREVGTFLKNEIRAIDYAARYGGEEFMVIMPECKGTDAANMADRLRLELKSIAEKVDLPLEQVGASFGVADYPDCGLDEASLVSAADAALLFSKRKGRNRVAYFRDLSDTELESGDVELLHNRLEGASMTTISALVDAVNSMDNYAGENLGLARIAGKIAAGLDMERDQTGILVLATQLHDVGKIGVPGSILGKTGKLQPDELALVKQHPEMGTRIVQEVEHLKGLVSGILYHHEKWDGTGYPEGLKGEKIPIIARVVGILDAYRAMRCDRPYRDALSMEQTLNELRKGAGSQFDPVLVQQFIKLCRDEMDEMPGERSA